MLTIAQLEGRWYGVYHRRAKGSDDVCPQLDVVVGNGYVNITERYFSLEKCLQNSMTNRLSVCLTVEEIQRLSTRKWNKTNT